jgi:hypothetical protein
MEQDKVRKYPRGARVEIDENGRRIVRLPLNEGHRLSIDSHGIRGKEVTKGQRYIRKESL